MRAYQVLAVVMALAAVCRAYPGSFYHNAGGAGAGAGGGEEGGDEGGYGGHGQVHKHVVDYYAHPKYHFDYAVHDPHTGDHKTQWETRDGDVVKGEYTIHDPDGTIRTVKYTSDKHSGFNAVVHRTGKSYHPQTYHHGGGSHY